MYKGIRNIVIHTETSDKQENLHFYLTVSGKRFYVKSQRFVHALHKIFKDGISIEELVRWDGRKPIGKATSGYIHTGKLSHTLKHLIPVIDFVLEDEGLVKEAA